jgi:hypothetical protein
MRKRGKGGGGNAHQRAIARKSIRVQQNPVIPAAGVVSTIWRQAFSWPVVGTVLGFMWGGGLTFMTSDHPILADSFYVAGTLLFVVKVVTWEETRQHRNREIIWVSVVVLTVLLTTGAMYGNHYLNRGAKDVASKQTDPPAPKEAAKGKIPEQPAPEQPPQPAPQPQHQPKLYTADVVMTLILPYFWGLYPTGTGVTVTPVDVILSLRIVNLQNRLASIIGFLVEAKTPARWIVLHRIPLSNITLYDGTWPLSSVRKLEFQPSDIGPELHVKELAPGQTVRGIALYDWGREEHPTIRAIRITIFDSAHNKDVIYPSSEQPPTMKPQDAYSSLEDLSMATTGPIVDLSSLPVERYSVRTGGK